MASALSGLKALDLSTRYAGAWCGRLLADFGADVILRDPHPVRDLAPFDGEGQSIPARYVLANRQSVTLDKDDSGWASVNGLADRSPLKARGFQASYQTGTVAYGAAVCG